MGEAPGTIARWERNQKFKPKRTYITLEEVAAQVRPVRHLDILGLEYERAELDSSQLRADGERGLLGEGDRVVDDHLPKRARRR